MAGLWERLFGPDASNREKTRSVPASDSGDIGWTVTGLYNSFPFQIGDKNYLAVVDTGAAVGACITYNDFEQLARAGFIRKVKPTRMYGISEQRPVKGYKQGIGGIVISDDNGKRHVLDHITIGTFPGSERMRPSGVPRDSGRRGCIILGVEFLERFGEVSFKPENGGYSFQAIMPSNTITQQII